MIRMGSTCSMHRHSSNNNHNRENRGLLGGRSGSGSGSARFGTHHHNNYSTSNSRDARSRHRARSGSGSSGSGRLGGGGASSGDGGIHGSGCRSCTRHSVVSAIPDDSIAALYPVDENYVRVGHGGRLRSPKTLAELATDALCRSLPLLDGELPAGLPQDVVDGIVSSLLKHSALNATTLRVLKNCELGALSLAGCRGVSDEWLEPLSNSGGSRSVGSSIWSCSSATSPAFGPSSIIPAASSSSSSSTKDGTYHTAETSGIEPMDLDGTTSSSPPTTPKVERREIFYGTFDGSTIATHSKNCNATAASPVARAHAEKHLPSPSSSSCSSSCSTSSFVSATSNPYAFDALAAPSLYSSPSSSLSSSRDRDYTMTDIATAAVATAACLKFEPEHQVSTERIREEDEQQSGDDDDVMMMKCPPANVAEPPLMSWSLTSSSSITSTITLLDLRGSQNLTDRGLLLLTDLTNLEVAKFDNCHGLVGRGLLALSSSHKLHTLSLANCRRLTDEAVINVAHLYIEALSLDGCRCITDRSLVALGDMYELRKLGLSQCDLITDDGLEQLVDLEFLEEISLGWCRLITDDGIGTFASHRGRESNLKILRLARCINITDEGIAHLTCLAALKELDLNGCSRISSAGLGKTLEQLTQLSTLDVSYISGILKSGFQGKINNLKTLEVCFSGVKDNHLGKLTHLPNLEEINLDSCPVGDWAISHFADNDVVPNLKSLDLADTDLTDNGMAKIAKFQNLTRLSLFYCNISNAGLKHLAKLKSLEVLNLDSREISDDGLRYLTTLRNLKSLDIFSGRITDSGCAHIASITSLESLELCGGGIADLGCTILATLENLTSLNLSQNERITNRGAAALAALTNLKALNLSNTRVNSSALRFFGGLLKLKSLSLYGCRGIEDTDRLEKLQDDLPKLKCLKLNRASDEDGIVLTDTSCSDDGSDGSGMWSQSPQQASDRDMDEDIDIYSDHD